MLNSDVTDQFHHVDGFANTRAAEEADFTAFGEGAEQIDNFDAGFQQLGRVGQFVISRSFAVDTPMRFGINRWAVVNCFAQDVHDASQRGFTDRHGNRVAGVLYFHAAR